MAAYAGVVSLMNTMEQIQNHPRLSSYFDRMQRKSLQEIAAFLLDFMEAEDCHGGMSKEEAEGLDRLIASAAHKAEDAVEFHTVRQIPESSNTLVDLKQVVKDMDSIKEKVREKWRRCKEEQPTYSTLPRAVEAGKSSTMVLEDEIRTRLLEMLAGQSSVRQVISIVGMGGIGKTTLARNAYECALIVQRFDVRAWAAVSQQGGASRVLKELLSCLKKTTAGSVDGLGEKLHKELYGRRYLITLDDVWSDEVWDKIKVYFPDNGNGSRVVMTTRRSKLAVASGSFVFEMKFLDEDKSWELLREKAFGSEEDRPPELVKIGKKIARKCRGLPLSIVVIGGLLRKSKRSEKSWKKVAGNISSILGSGEDEQCRNVLYLSYSEMPPRLKPCFLYLGVFGEDEKICASKLVKLWASEGFLRPNEAQSSEEVGERCLKELIERNLVLVHKWALNHKVKTCGVHDLLRELCLSVAKKERFFLDMRVRDATPQGISGRIVVQGGRDRDAIHGHAGSSSRVRSLTLDGGPVPSSAFPLLRVLSNVTGGSLKNVTNNVNLRYLSQTISESSNFKLPTSMSMLWNLQTIIIEGGDELKIDATFRIWEMRQLRHLETDVHIFVPEPPGDGFVLRNLQTLVDVKKLRLSDEVCRRIPNIKKLHIRYPKFSNKYCLNNLSRLQNLQTLNFYISDNGRRDDLVKNLAFPSSLRRLSLRGCRLRWDDITEIGRSLPRLEVLKLKRDAAGGNEWLPVEGAFPSLKLLRLNRLDIVNWVADSSHFPVLVEMFLRRLDVLDEIPLDIGDIPTLECIRLEDCSSSASVSSARILEEQLSLGNEDLQVRVSLKVETAAERTFLEKVDIGSFPLKNFVYKSNR